MFQQKSLAFGLVVLLAGCHLICGQMDVQVKDEDIAKHKTTTTTTTLPPTSSTSSSTSSTSSTTTTTTTTTTAPPPTTPTSTSTTSTTPAPVTTTPTPKPTTPAPQPTTTPSPVTTTPKPFPAPEVGKWNSSCILLKMAAQLNFTYLTQDNKTAVGLMNIPKNAVVGDVDCNTTATQTITLNWGPADAVSAMHIGFQNNKTISVFKIYFSIPLKADELPNSQEQVIQLVHLGMEFDSPVKMSYHCTRSQHFNLTETVQTNATTIGVLTVHDVQTEAFRTGAKPDDVNFSTVHDCDSSQTSDIVPITVGVALVLLILIVLTAYLCARRRSASRGYVSF